SSRLNGLAPVEDRDAGAPDGEVGPTDAAGGVDAPAVVGEGWRSGQRLRVISWITDDASAELPFRIFDQQLGVQCTFADSGNGMRCLPLPEGTFFSADGCQTKKLVLPDYTFATPPTYVAYRSSSDSCDGPLTAYKVGMSLGHQDVLYPTCQP